MYNCLARIPEQYRGLLIDELSDRGLVNCWFIAGLLYKVKLTEREATGPMDVSYDLEEYQERLERLAAGAIGGERDGLQSEEKEEKEKTTKTKNVDEMLMSEKVDDDDYVYVATDDADEAAAAARRRAEEAAAAGVQVFEGRAANVPGGPLINRFQKVFYPAGGWEAPGVKQTRASSPIRRVEPVISPFLRLVFSSYPSNATTTYGR